MRDFILTRSATILCPHGGFVTHIPLTHSEYLIEGQQPMLMTDQYLVTGCPFFVGSMPSQCVRVIWTTASMMMFVQGNPVLLQSSVGIALSVAQVPNGPVIVASCQSTVREPDTVTNVN